VSEATAANAFEEAIRTLMRADGSVVYLGEEHMGLSEEFEHRVIAMPMGENVLSSSALGLALTGAKPIVSIPGEYLLRHIDTIGNEIALTQTVTNGQYGSGVIILSEIGNGPWLGPQLSQSYEALFSAFPGLAVCYPSNPADAGAVLFAAAEYPGPVLILTSRHASAAIAPSIPGGVAEIGKSYLSRVGDDVTIATYGPMLPVCLAAAETAMKSGLSCEVIDLLSLNPMDISLVIASIKKTGKLAIAHEARKSHGISAEIAAKIAESDALFYLDSKIARVCAKDIPIPYQKGEYAKAVPGEEAVLKAIIQLSSGE